MEKIDTITATAETVLERPPLVVGPLTGNIGLLKGTHYIYIKINCVFNDLYDVYFVGNRRKVRDMVEYIGPIDDEMMANILIYGG
jgi:hypothetical protein